MYSKSQAAAGLCSWVKNIMVFHYINENVKPLRAALAQANVELRTAMEKLNSLRSRLEVNPAGFLPACRLFRRIERDES